MNAHYDTSKPVLVTGATGYVAGWLVKRLLEEGFTVHAAVRDPSNADKVGHLQAMADGTDGTLKLFAADLLEEGSYAEAMAGTGTVFHTASPFTLRVRDPQADLIDPALKGTRNVLASADATESVERVVLTSSVAAIYGDTKDVADAPGGVLTEDVWNTTSSLDHQPYSFSKTVAERAAWEMAEAQDRWKLVVINPSLVVGPGTRPDQTSESFNLVRMLGNGTFAKGAPPLSAGLVDVRDVAEAHMQAAFVPDAEGRHIISAETGSFMTMADALRPAYGGDWPLPEVGAPAEDTFAADNSRSRKKLGITYRPVDEAMREMFAQMVQNGLTVRS